MKLWFALGLFAVSILGTAEPVTLINTLAERPVFNVVTAGVVVTRTVAPGTRVSVDPGLFSGLGDKKVPLAAGTTYYFARFGATPGLYRLAPEQVIILNQSNRAVPVILGSTRASAVLASGNFALGELTDGKLTVEWDDAGTTQTIDLDAGGVYRLRLDSPEGVGTTVTLTPWN